MITINRTLAIVLCAAWLLAGYGTGASATSTPKVPRLISSSCPFPVGFGLAAGKTVRCGYLIVPEDRNKPNGRAIKLAVAVFKSPVQHSAPDPVLYLAGGPGDPALSGLGQALTVTNESDVVGDRDLILIDQRGTGYSQPSLACPAAAHLIQVPPQPVGKELASLDSAYHQCHDRLVHDGVDLSAYNTVENAADITDLRKALGYRTVNLYGVSYGTRLALTVMRDYPQGIRSVVLDSVVPPQHDYAALLRSVQPAFTTLFHGCAQAPNCSREFPHLQQVFDQAVAHLDTKPLRVKVGGRGEQLLTGYQLSQVLYLGLYRWQDLPLLPKMLYQIRQGNAAIAAQIMARVQAAYGLVSWGMYQSVKCSEAFAFDSQSDLTAAVQGLPSPLRADTLQHALNAMKICHIWHVRAVSRKEMQAVHSTIPTLILDGQYDPVTPPAYGQLVLKTLSHGFRYVFPGLAHGVRFAHSCPSSITWAFIDHPTRKPDASCISSLPSAFY